MTWREVVEVDLIGVFLCCRAVVPTFIRQNYGRIVSVASVAGKEGNPNASAYSAAKAGVIALTKSLGKELAGYDIAVELRHAGSGADTNLRTDDRAAHRVHALEDPARTVPSERRARVDGRLARVAGELIRDRRGVRREWRPGDVLRA